MFRPELKRDQDRRPLSPPPIIQLRIFDKLGNAIKSQCVVIHFYRAYRISFVISLFVYARN